MIGKGKKRGHEGTVIQDIQNSLNELQPEAFLASNEEVSSKALDTLKSLYDFTKDQESSSPRIQSLSQGLSSASTLKRSKKLKLSRTETPLANLITKSFDADQIWEEVQLQNGLMYENLVSSVSRLLAHSRHIHNSLQDSDEEEEPSHSGLPTSADLSSEDEESEIEFEGNRKPKKAKSKSRSQATYSKSIVDDKFFNLAQMTEFLETVEAQIEAERDPSAAKEESDSEDDIDWGAGSDEDEKETTDADDNGNVYYRDFFDPPLDEVEGEDKTEAQKEDKAEDDDTDADSSVENEYEEEHEGKSVRFNLEEDEDEDDQSDEDDEKELEDALPLPKKPKADEDEDLKPNPSNFERRNKKIEENIKQMEDEALEPKAWQFQGEVTAERRPENSLLEEHLIFDHLLRAAPEATAETTLKLEDIIKQRIKDQAWDDVVRKAKPVEDSGEFKKKIVMDAEKSKLSLAQIYEQEYINKKKVEDGEEEKEVVPEEEIKIQNDMKSLFAKLDALSNFHYTPKAPSADIKIVTNLPTISMEEVAPVNVSDATLLAPQEIQEPAKGEIKSKIERTDTDKKRERRVKKKKQHGKRIDREEKTKLKGIGLRNIKLADNIKKKSRGNAAEESFQNTKELKSSKAFFSKLQEQAQTQIKDTLLKKKKTSSKTLIPKRFKM